jgi:hypothetical protein
MKQVCIGLKSEKWSPSDRRFETRTRVWAGSLEGSLGRYGLGVGCRVRICHPMGSIYTFVRRQVARLLAHSALSLSLHTPDVGQGLPVQILQSRSFILRSFTMRGEPSAPDMNLRMEDGSSPRSPNTPRGPKKIIHSPITSRYNAHAIS